MMCTVYAVQDEIYHSSKGSSVIGLLDIYGFEVLQHNRYGLYSFPLHRHLLLSAVRQPVSLSKVAFSVPATCGSFVLF